MPKKKKTETKNKTKKAKKPIKATKRKKITKPRKKTARKAKKIKEEKGKYYEAVGRRKTAVARVRIYPEGEKKILINNKPYEEYFPTLNLRETAMASLKAMNSLERFGVSVIVRGGGITAQAEAVRHGTARALVEFNPDFRKRLSKAGYLTRDPRMRERKKFGLKRARRAPQWSKR